MQIKLALGLTLLAASCSSVPPAAARPRQGTDSTTVAPASPGRWDHGVTLAWNQRSVDSQWDPASSYRGGSIEYSGLMRIESGQGTGIEVSFGRAESDEFSHVFGYRPSTWRRWTDYSIGVRHERPLGFGRWLLSGGFSYIRVELDQNGLSEILRLDLGSSGAYMRTGYIQPLSRNVELVVSGRYRVGRSEHLFGRELDLDHVGIDVGLSWRF
ncbi:hypothetical protein Poly30_48280 [Planctomycetes bacterium Poly30]|uniref:Outer membrane protein beta-barrel domain-containing protein n=1 Tax=Saltatorellus ferox TaxID=2528018 RepID=A0A518EYV8_9BACT|nr:hypothetical protein Poly30_48280 [Planctomycetes bacterium Poly30]